MFGAFRIRKGARHLATTLILVLGILPWPAFGDVIVLRNQKYLKGSVVRQTATSILFRTRSGRVVQIPKSRIRRVLYISAAQEKAMDRRAGQAARARIMKRKREAAQRRAAEEARRREKMAKAAAEKKRRTEAARLAKKRAEKQLRESSQQKTGALWRSLLLPGWGQWYAKRERPAYTIGGTFLGALLFSYTYRQRFYAAQKDYRFAADRLLFDLATPGGTQNAGLLALNLSGLTTDRRRLKRATWRSNIFTNALLGAYLWNLGDAFNHRWGFSDRLLLSITANDGGMGLALRLEL